MPFNIPQGLIDRGLTETDFEGFNEYQTNSLLMEKRLDSLRSLLDRDDVSLSDFKAFDPYKIRELLDPDKSLQNLHSLLDRDDINLSDFQKFDIENIEDILADEYVENLHSILNRDDVTISDIAKFSINEVTDILKSENQEKFKSLLNRDGITVSKLANLRLIDESDSFEKTLLGYLLEDRRQPGLNFLLDLGVPIEEFSDIYDDELDHDYLASNKKMADQGIEVWQLKKVGSNEEISIEDKLRILKGNDEEWIKENSLTPSKAKGAVIAVTNKINNLYDITNDLYPINIDDKVAGNIARLLNESDISKLLEVDDNAVYEMNKYRQKEINRRSEANRTPKFVERNVQRSQSESNLSDLLNQVSPDGNSIGLKRTSSDADLSPDFVGREEQKDSNPSKRQRT